MTLHDRIERAAELLDASRGALTEEGFAERRRALDEARSRVQIPLEEAHRLIDFAVAGLDRFVAEPGSLIPVRGLDEIDYVVRDEDGNVLEIALKNGERIYTSRFALADEDVPADADRPPGTSGSWGEA